MPITKDQLDNFHQYATEKLDNGGVDLSWPALFDLWRIENLTADLQAEIYAALDESLDDIHSGRHRPANEVMRELRAKHNLAE